MQPSTPQQDPTLTSAQNIFLAFCRNMKIPESLSIPTAVLSSDKDLAEIIFWAARVKKYTGKMPTLRDVHKRIVATTLKGARAQSTSEAPEKADK